MGRLTTRQERARERALQVLNHSTEEWSPTEEWTDADWDLFQDADMTEKMEFFQELAQDPDEVREYGVGQFTEEQIPFKEFGVKTSAKRIIADVEAGNG